MTIRFYRVRDPNGELSHHSAHAFESDGLFWPTIEHHYQAQKFVGTPIGISRGVCAPAPRGDGSENGPGREER